MASANQEIADRLVRHQVYLQRYGTSVVTRVMALLNRADRDMVEQIERRLAKQTERGFDTGPATTKRLNDTLGEIRAINRAAYDTAGKALTDDLRELATYEVDWAGKVVGKPLPRGMKLTQPPMDLVRAAVTARPFQGKLLKEWLQGLEGAKAARVRDAIRLGLVEGETIDQMVRRIRGTKSLKYADGLMEIDRRNAAAMVRTAVNHTASAAREALYSANDDILSGEQWLATLDTKTCPTCAALDGQKFERGKGPQSPRHVGCRCLRVPVVKSWRELGFDFDEMPPMTRASMDGQVPGKMSYSDWLKKQSFATQIDILGPGRAEMFRAGVPVDAFVDRAGKQLTLDQLRQSDEFDLSSPPGGGTMLPPSRGGKLTKAQAAAEADAIDYVMKMGAAEAAGLIEYAAAYAEDGAEVLRKRGGRRTVGFNPSQRLLMRDTTLVHNHPSGLSLSGEDLFFVTGNRLKEILAVPTAGGGLFRAAPVIDLETLRRAYKKTEAHVERHLWAALHRGEITYRQSDHLRAHMVNSALDSVGAVAYKAQVTQAIDDAITSFGEAEFLQAIKDFKWTP